jgi:hypothetical protein
MTGKSDDGVDCYDYTNPDEGDIEHAMVAILNTSCIDS